MAQKDRKTPGSVASSNVRMNQHDMLDQTAQNAGLDTSEQRYHQLADAMPQIVWTANPDGWLDYYNQRWFDYTGMTLEQTQGWGWGPVLHPDDLQRCIDSWNESLSTGHAYEIEYRFKTEEAQRLVELLQKP